MRYYIPQCKKCSHKKEECESFLSIKKSFKNLNINSVGSVTIRCRAFQPISKVGDLIEFEMCGNTLIRPVFYVENNHRTFIVLTANNLKNKELFTLTIDDYKGGEHYKKYYSDEHHYNIKNNLMLGFVNYKYVKRVIKNVVIPNMEWKNDIDYSKFDFLKRGLK